MFCSCTCNRTQFLATIREVKAHTVPPLVEHVAASTNSSISELDYNCKLCANEWSSGRIEFKGMKCFDQGNSDAIVNFGYERRIGDTQVVEKIKS